VSAGEEKPELFEYRGYEIPVDLVNLTGGGTDTWDAISKGHMVEYERYCPIAPDHAVLEIGCGVGRDAIQLTTHLSSAGKYIGIDIIKPSIEWCQQNISTKYPNFAFHYLDIGSQIHNPAGTQAVTAVTLPVRTWSIDRIVLHSVFTHMFRDDIVHYLREFARVLRPGGRVMASVFVVDDESLELARATGQSLTFDFPYGDGCRINDERFPEGAIGYTVPALDAMLSAGGLELVGPIHRGFWCGRTGTDDGQDVLVLQPTARGRVVGVAAWLRGRARRLAGRAKRAIRRA
jgi:ubiquinone/menaquinone biosynthesis C-methylase UbiE